MDIDSSPPQPRVLSIKEAARACGISRATLYRLINDRKLATVKIASRPYLVECAFGLRQSGLDGNPGPRFKLAADRRLIDTGEPRLIVTGANWSVGIQNPFCRFGRTGEGLESTLAQVRANTSQPVIMALHLAKAFIQYADRGKSSIIVEGDVEAADV